MKIVKLTFPYPDWPLLRQTPNSLGIWGNFQFHINDTSIKECDYWVVFEGLLTEETVRCDKKNIIFIAAECTTTGLYSENFIAQFGKLITCQDRIKHNEKKLTHTANPWFVGKSYDELIANIYVAKTKNISLICSDKQFTDGHKKRYDFCMKLKDYFGNDIDLFGRNIRDFDDKWDVLADYKYSIAIENHVENNWFTEKLYDCFLAHTVPFYYGCPNIDNYFAKNSCIGIDLENFEHSKEVIEKTMNDAHKYELMLPQIIENKIKYLNNYNLFPLVTNFIENQKVRNSVSLTTNTIYKTPSISFLKKIKKYFS